MTDLGCFLLIFEKRPELGSDDIGHSGLTQTLSDLCHERPVFPGSLISVSLCNLVPFWPESDPTEW
jgi:hypothetical protein